MTQTEREVAVNQQKLYDQQKQAEVLEEIQAKREREKKPGGVER